MSFSIEKKEILKRRYLCFHKDILDPRHMVFCQELKESSQENVTTSILHLRAPKYEPNQESLLQAWRSNTWTCFMHMPNVMFQHRIGSKFESHVSVPFFDLTCSFHIWPYSKFLETWFFKSHQIRTINSRKHRSIYHQVWRIKVYHKTTYR